MDLEYEKYLKDERIPCKYGTKCYQKNPAHHEKYKHPPKKTTRHLNKPATKKFKATNRVVVKQNASDSEDSTDSDVQNTSTGSAETPTFSSEIETKKVNNDVSDSNSESAETSDKDIRDVSVAKDDKTTNVDEQEDIHTEIKTSNNSETPNYLNTTEQNWTSFIKDKFLVTMPEDFYQFWNFCKKLKPTNPSDAFKEVGLSLIGPYDVLAGKFSGKNLPSSDYLIHWRYYRDPPELQTVLKSDDPAGYHIGYFRDTPEDLPVFLASNSVKKNGILTQMGGNIFSSVNIFLEELKKSGNPFKKMAIGKLQLALTKEAERLEIDLSKRTKAMIDREKKIVTRTFNKIGLVVPYNKKTELGYRPLTLENKNIESLFTKLQNATTKEEKDNCLSSLQPMFTFASIAADEGDFGTGIELGWNIISHGVDSLNRTAERFLVSNYKLLNREAFAKIAEAHMQNRKQVLSLSIV